MNLSGKNNSFLCAVAICGVFCIAAFAFGDMIANTWPIEGAHFKAAAKAKQTYEITVTSGDNGLISPSTTTFSKGRNAVFTIKPIKGYIIDTITVDGADVDLSQVKDLSKPYRYPFKRIVTDHTINATFKPIPTYEITVSSGDNGLISPSTTTFKQGANATFTITPSKGYRIDTLTVDGADVDLLAVYDLSKRYTVRFKGIDSEHSIIAAFKEIHESATVLTARGANGQISPAAMIFKKGSNATFTVTPSGEYVIDAIAIDGKYIDLTKVTDLSKPYKIKFTRMFDDHFIFAIFKPKGAPSVPSPFVGHYTGRYYTNEGKEAGTISLTVDEKGMTTATFDNGTTVHNGTGIADTEKITFSYGSTGFQVSFNSQSGIIGITGGIWSYCPCGIEVAPPLERCMAPCSGGGTWTAQQEKQ
ncbi:MAG: hypothetical protein HY880_05185 [Deltaproteobacteria bacterium]|nr:hypothetical protein [Deltaproteobacteria bacterium]